MSWLLEVEYKLLNLALCLEIIFTLHMSEHLCQNVQQCEYWECLNQSTLVWSIENLIESHTKI